MLVRAPSRCGELTFEVPTAELLRVCEVLRDDPGLRFEQLVDLTGIDYLEYGRVEWETAGASNRGFSRGRSQPAGGGGGERRFAVVYHLLSLANNRRLRLRVWCEPGEPPLLDSVVGIWASANWNNMRKSQRAALDKFSAAGVAAGDTISVILTDPRAGGGKVRAQLGYILADNATIPDGLKAGRIERRPVYSARVQAVVLLAPSKAYQALSDALAPRGRGIVMPTVELYRPAGQANRIGTFTLEMDR